MSGQATEQGVIVALSEEDLQQENLVFCKGCQVLYDPWTSYENEPTRPDEFYHAITTRKPGDYTLRVLTDCACCQ